MSEKENPIDSYKKRASDIGRQGKPMVTRMTHEEDKEVQRSWEEGLKEHNKKTIGSLIYPKSNLRV